jgi:hypothetical protein
MPVTTQHIIHRLFVEVETNSAERGYAIKEDAAGFISGRIAPELEKLFEKLEASLGGKVLTIDRLSVGISLGPGEWDSLANGNGAAEAIAGKVSEKLEERLEGIQDLFAEEEESRIVSAEQRELTAVLHFLRTGKKPWWIVSNKAMKLLLSEEKLKALAVSDPEILLAGLGRRADLSFVRRLVYQLPSGVLAHWFSVALGESGFTVPERDILDALEEAPEENLRLLLRLVRTVASGSRMPPVLKEVMQRSSAVNAIAATIVAGRHKGEDGREASERPSEKRLPTAPGRAASETGVSENPESDPADPEDDLPEASAEDEDDDEMLAGNAGIILLHPFLGAFFSEVGLLAGNKLTDPVLAAHVLYFLSTGSDCAHEFELQAEKALCGIPASVPVPRDIAIPEMIRAEAGDLLAAALGHWKGLKTDSAELLRTEFLQREARINTDELQAVRLVFERKTHDILLDSLPWNLGIVKLSWKKELICVEW